MILFLLLLSFSLPASDFYRSNSLAMELEALSEDLDFSAEKGWILERIGKGSEVELILYNDGVEDSRYNRTFSTAGILLQSTTSKNGMPVEEATYRDDGQLLRETFYDEAGNISEIKNYIYGGDARLLRVEVEKDGQISSHMIYSLRQVGSLRNVEIKDSEGNRKAASVLSYGDTLYFEETDEGDIRIVRYFDNMGNLVKIVRYKDSEMILKEERKYSDGGILENINIQDYLLNQNTVKISNRSGRIIREETFRDEELIDRILFTYLSDRLERKERKAPGIRDSWVYKYTNDILAEEEYYDRDVLEHKKIYDSENNSDYVLELYDRGEVFMKVHYIDDEKVREEFISGGVVTRTREWGD